MELKSYLFRTYFNCDVMRFYTALSVNKVDVDIDAQKSLN